MPQPTSPAAYGPQLRSLWDRAKASPNGIEITLPAYAEAFFLRNRLYAARISERKTIIAAYGEGTPCPWDSLMIVLSPDGYQYKLKIVPADISISTFDIKEI